MVLSDANQIRRGRPQRRDCGHYFFKRYRVLFVAALDSPRLEDFISSNLHFRAIEEMHNWVAAI